MRKYLAVARIGFMERAAYRGDVLGRGFMLLLFLFILSRLWGTVLRESMEGFDHSAVVWYFVITEGLMMATPGLGQQINEEVRSGSFSAYLIRPCRYLLFHLSGYLGKTTLGLLINLGIGSAVALWLVGLPVVRLMQLPLSALTIVLGLVINFLITMVIALSAFWVEDNEPFFWIYSKFQLILGGVLIPLDFFPALLRKVAASLPFSYIFYRPARLCVAFEIHEGVSVISGQLLWILLLGLLLQSLYDSGVKKVNVNGG